MAPSSIVFSILLYACAVESGLGASTVRSQDTKTCTTEICKKKAKEMMSLMDQTVSPCVDFNKYACGNFIKETKLGNMASGFGTFVSMAATNNKLKQELLESPIKDKRPDSFEAKMKTFYKSCMDLVAMERRGLKDYKWWYRQDWPTLNPKWTVAYFDLQSLNIEYAKTFTDVLFSIGMVYDVDDSKKGSYKLEMNQPAFILSGSQLQAPWYTKPRLAYEKYYVDVAMALGADYYTAAYDARSVIAFMSSISEYFGDASSFGDPSVTRNPSTLEEMNRDYPYLDWVKLVQARYKEMNIDIKADQRVNVVFTKYFKGLETAVKTTSRRVIQNLFGFIRATKVIDDATRFTRANLYKFKGISENRVAKCVSVVDDLYNYGMAKLMSYSRFSKKGKDFMDTLIGNLKDEYIESLQSQDWLAESTKQEAITKIKSLRPTIGMPSEKFTEADLDKYYKNYKVDRKLYIKTLLQNQHQKKIQNYERINKPQGWSWDTSLTVANAYYIQARVAAAFPLGLLQTPMFDQNSPGYLNYGGIGYFIGHEIGHSLDTTGRRYDAQGYFRDWWTSGDGKNYDEKAKCYIDQYSKFFVPQINMWVNGTKSRTENIADNQGTAQAYKAYMKYSSEHPEELPLPDLGLTKEQLFFLSTAQIWCFKAKDWYLKLLLDVSNYSPNEFRTIGMMQNSQAFAEAFKCKKGDYMNPEKKCTLW